MPPLPANPVVHLELRTGSPACACAFYTRLFGWRAETVHINSRSYLALALGDGIGGGVAEADTERALWLPYVHVASIADATDRACELGATVVLPPREGPVGWRSVVSSPDGGEIAMWQPKGRDDGARDQAPPGA